MSSSIIYRKTGNINNIEKVRYNIFSTIFFRKMIFYPCTCTCTCVNAYVKWRFSFSLFVSTFLLRLYSSSSISTSFSSFFFFFDSLHLFFLSGKWYDSRKPETNFCNFVLFSSFPFLSPLFSPPSAKSF